MNARGTSGDIAKLHASENIYYINEGDAAFDPSRNEISWRPNQIVLTDDNVVLFPATILAHEAKHGVQKDEMPAAIFDEKREVDNTNPYGNELEKEVITTIEQVAAQKHGDIEEGELTRMNHRGEFINIMNFPATSIVEDFRTRIMEKFKSHLIDE